MSSITPDSPWPFATDPDLDWLGVIKEAGGRIVADQGLRDHATRRWFYLDAQGEFDALNPTEVEEWRDLSAAIHGAGVAFGVEATIIHPLLMLREGLQDWLNDLCRTPGQADEDYRWSVTPKARAAVNAIAAYGAARKSETISEVETETPASVHPGKDSVMERGYDLYTKYGITDKAIVGRLIRENLWPIPDSSGVQRERRDTRKEANAFRIMNAKWAKSKGYKPRKQRRAELKRGS